MPTYLYECPQCHRRVDVVKPMADSGRPEQCPDGMTIMRRIFTAPLKQIIRPSGWRLSPDDPKFGDFRRELELGELKDDASPVYMSQAEIDAFDNPPVQIAPDPERDHRLSQLIKQHWTNDLSDDTVRRRELAAIAHKSEEATATCAP